MFTALSDEIRPLKFKFSSSRSCTPPPPECLFDNIAAAAVTARSVSQQLKVLRLQCHAASLSPSQSLHPPSCRDSGTVNAANEVAKISISLVKCPRRPKTVTVVASTPLKSRSFCARLQGGVLSLVKPSLFVQSLFGRNHP